MANHWIRTIGFFLLVSSCADTSANREGEAADTPGLETPSSAVLPRTIPVRVAAVRQEDVREEIDLTGTAQPWDEFIVSSEVSGRVIALLAEEGDWVRRGQLVTELDKELRLIQLRSRRANLGKAEIEVTFAESRLERGRRLLEKGAISEEALESLDRVLQINRSEVEIAQIEVDSIEEEIEDTAIFAQAAGRVSERHVSLGETVSAASPLYTIIQENPLKIVTEIMESQLHFVRKGQPVTMVLDAFPEGEFRATVHFVHPVSNPLSGAFPVELRLSNPRLAIKPGMTARIRMPVATYPQALLVPLDALIDTQSGHHLFALRDGLAIKVEVRLLRRIGSSGMIEGPLQAGEPVVTSGKVNLTHETPVEVIS